jgi:integrase
MLKRRSSTGPWQIHLPPLNPGEAPYRKSTGTSDKREAQKLHDEVERERLRGRLGLTVTRGGITLAEAHKQVMALHWKHLKTPETFEVLHKAWAGSLGPSVPLAGITQARLVAVVTAWQEAEKAPATINRRLAYLRTLMLKARELLKADVPDLKWPYQSEKGRPMPYLFTPEDEQAIGEYFRAREEHAMAALCIVLGETGLRLGEALRARPSDVSGHSLAVWENKADHPRTVPLTDRAWLALNELWGHKGLPKWRAEQLWDQMRKVVFAQVVGQVGRITMHGLRHTVGTRLLRGGMDVRHVQAWLGHKDIATTLIYAHVDAEDLRYGVAVLNRTREGVREVCGGT